MPGQPPLRTILDVGAVGGIDVGWSEKRASSAVARLEWTSDSVSFSVRRYRATDPERSSAIEQVLAGGVLAVAIDGPLCTGLVDGSNYRFAERMLTLGFQPHIGKPGQTSSPNGRKLNQEATRCARLLVANRLVGSASHPERIHSLAIVEAFPTSFLGLLLPKPIELRTERGKLSDIFFEALSASKGLDNLLARLLPGRTLQRSFADVRNHDDRAAVVCALTALCLATGDYTAVGDNDGWILLPPRELVQPWANEIAIRNAARLAGDGELPRLGIKLGLLAGMYPEIAFEQMQAGDDEIAASFLTGDIEPEVHP